MFYLELDCLQDGEISSPRIAVHGQIIFDRLLQLESKNESHPARVSTLALS